MSVTTVWPAAAIELFADTLRETLRGGTAGAWAAAAAVLAEEERLPMFPPPPPPLTFTFTFRSSSNEYCRMSDACLGCLSRRRRWRRQAGGETSNDPLRVLHPSSSEVGSEAEFSESELPSELLSPSLSLDVKSKSKREFLE
jgi:hypothetical protein